MKTEIDKPDCSRTAPVVIINTIGDLQSTYSVASIVFCGGSLAPLGGQNVLEAAAWGKPVLYGPSMEDFLDAKSLLEEHGAGITVLNGKMLAEKAIWFLDHPEALLEYGKQAREAVLKNENAAENHAGVILSLIRR